MSEWSKKTTGSGETRRLSTKAPSVVASSSASSSNTFQAPERQLTSLRSKKQSAAANRTSLTILLLGDDGVGKSSLISTFVSRHFSEVGVPGVMTRVRLPPNPSAGSSSPCVTTIVDSRGADAALASAALSASVPHSASTTSLMQQATPSPPSWRDSADAASPGALRSSSASTLPVAEDDHILSSPMGTASTGGSALGKPAGSSGGNPASSTVALDNVDSIVLVYDLDRAETFSRLESHWLPLIERYYTASGDDADVPPVIIAGNKMDLFRPSASVSGVDEDTLQRSRQQIVALLQKFKFVRQCIKCSARNLLNVDDIFLKAQQAVLYPILPLYDLNQGHISTPCRKAFERIFRIFDLDNDGLLSNRELNDFQKHAFDVPLVERDLTGWKKVVSKHSLANDAVVKDGKFTVVGFLAIFDVFISQNRLEVPWRILRIFGYDEDLNLKIPSVILTGPSPGESPAQSSSRNKSPQEDRFGTSLSAAACYFLTGVFHQFNSNHDGILSRDDLCRIFSILPDDEAVPPWHPLRSPNIFKTKFSVPMVDVGEPVEQNQKGRTANPKTSDDPEREADQGGITIVGGEETIDDDAASRLLIKPMSFLDWIGHWSMIASISPSTARAELYRLGHAAIAKAASKRRKKSLANRSGPYGDYALLLLPSRELRVVVIGKKQSGKTELVNGLCNISAKVQESLMATPDDLGKPTTSCTYVRMNKGSPTTFQKGGEIGKGDDTLAHEDIVVHLIFTVLPESLDSEELRTFVSGGAIGSRTSSEAPRPCDVILFAFDCFDEESCKYCQDIEESLVSESKPRIFVGTNRHRDDSDAATAAAGTSGRGSQYDDGYRIGEDDNDEEQGDTDEGDKSDDDDGHYEGPEAVIIATEHCAELDIDPPLVVYPSDLASGSPSSSHRTVVLKHLAGCVMEGGIVDAGGGISGGLRLVPHARKRLDAARRRSMFRRGAFISLAVVGFVGAGGFWWFGSAESVAARRKGTKELIEWFKSMVMAQVGRWTSLWPTKFR